MIVVLTNEAEAELEGIGDHIAKDNPLRAASFVRELWDRCQRLAATPEAFPLVPRYEHMGVRRRVHGNYLIFYRIGLDAIEVIHILHGAMNYEPVLFPKD